MRLIFTVLIFLAALGGATVRAAHTDVQLLLSAATARPGDTIWAGVDLKMEPGWHTYWKNPGEAGEATQIKWQLPPGITAGEIQWPLPEKLPPLEITTYGYEDETVLLVPLKIATNVPPGELNLKANVSWLECKESCIPAAQEVEAKLTIGSETKNSPDAATIDLWKKKVPQPYQLFTLRAYWEKVNGDTRSLIIEGYQQVSFFIQLSDVDFFPDASDNFEVQPATEIITANHQQIALRKFVKKFSGDWPKEISGVVVLNSAQAFETKLSIADQIPTNKMISAISPASNSTNSSSNLPTKSIWQYLLYAFIGGLILNIMPCVLPVIALKILGFVSEAKSEPRRVRALGLIYALGVLFSFLVLAGIIIGVKAAGNQIGWGFQFGNPIFLVCLITLVTLVALNLFGVFEVTLGGRALNTAGELASKHGAAGAFFNGVLATALATPCTAPFLGASLGFAFAQNAATIIFIFLAAGLGLAAPYVLLSWNPAWLKFLPKPGAWMEKFKIAMGFPMLATVVWLLYIATGTYGKDVAWLGGFLVVVALAAWIFGEFIQRGRTGKFLAGIIVLLLLAGDYVLILEKTLNWRAPMIETLAGNSDDKIDWQPWSPAAVAQARAGGHPVIVDFTADWCLTCQVNKKTSIEIPSVEKKLKDLNFVTLVGDYTHTPANITAELTRYQRAGVPLVLVYPKSADAPPMVLPEILTPGIVLDALDQAAK
jgi:thiol:disulfide interchange protein DsbD